MRNRRRAWTREASTYDVARFAGVTVRTVFRWIRAGELPGPARTGKPHTFDMPTVLRHVERINPDRSVTLAAGWGANRARWAQWRRIGMLERIRRRSRHPLHVLKRPSIEEVQAGD